MVYEIVWIEPASDDLVAILRFFADDRPAESQGIAVTPPAQ